jgi:sugar lactone lactonase YvrE
VIAARTIPAKMFPAALLLGAAAELASAQKVPEDAPPIRLVPLGIVVSHPFGARFHECAGLGFDPGRQEVVVCDPKSNRISAFSLDGFPRFSIGEGAGLNEPKAIAVGPGRDFFVVDATPGRLLRLNYRGEPVDEIDMREPGEISPPRVVAVARVPDGGIAVLLQSPPRIRSFDSNMVERVRIARENARDQLREPTDLAVDRQGFFYVTDYRGAAVQVYDPKGRLVEAWGQVGEGIGPTDFTLPTGIAVDRDGRIFVIDTVRQDIRAYERGGRLVGLWGGFGGGVGAVGYPVDLVLDSEGTTVCVSEKSGRRVQFFRIEVGESREAKAAGTPRPPP